MTDDLHKTFGLKSLEITDVQVSHPGMGERPARFYDARCFGQCEGGDFDQEEKLREELGRMYREGRTTGELHIGCPRYKDTGPRRRAGPPRAPSRSSSREHRQTCLGSLSAKITVEYAEGHPRH